MITPFLFARSTRCEQQEIKHIFKDIISIPTYSILTYLFKSNMRGETKDKHTSQIRLGLPKRVQNGFRIFSYGTVCRKKKPNRT